MRSFYKICIYIPVHKSSAPYRCNTGSNVLNIKLIQGFT